MRPFVFEGGPFIPRQISKKVTIGGIICLDSSDRLPVFAKMLLQDIGHGRIPVLCATLDPIGKLSAVSDLLRC